MSGIVWNNNNLDEFERDVVIPGGLILVNYSMHV